MINANDNERKYGSPLTAIFKKELVRKYGLFFVLSHLTGDRQQSPVSRTLKVNAILAVCVKRSLTKRRAHAVVFVEMHNPYHFIFFKAFQRIAQPGTNAARQVALRNIAIDNDRDIFA